MVKIKDELIKGSFILFFTINIFNVLNYFFHFAMARMLSVSEYGILAVLMSLIYFFNIPGNALQTTVSRYTTKFNIKKRKRKIKGLMIDMFKKSLYLSFIIFILFTLLSPLLSWFLRIEIYLLIITALFIFDVFFISVVRGLLQGQKKFKELGLNMVFEGSSKLLIAIILVMIGCGVSGAISGVIIAPILALFLAFIPLKNILKVKEDKSEFKEMYSYGKNVFILMICIVLLYSIDIILARRFFSPELVGKYAVASMIGKMIFFGTYGISQGMFPLVSEKHDKKEKTEHIFKKAIMLVIFISFFVLLFIFFFPQQIIKILFGKKYVEISSILIYVALAYTFISLTNIVIFYSLKRKNFNIILLMIFFIFFEIIILTLFKSNIFSFSIAFTIINLLIFIFSLISVKNE